MDLIISIAQSACNFSGKALLFV